MHIDDLVSDAYDHAYLSGFHENTPDELDDARGREWFAAKLALIHSEVSEALEEVRSNERTLDHYYTLPGTGTRWPSMRSAKESIHGPKVNPKPEGVASELADVVIRIADLAGATGIDLDAAITEKLAYNRTRTRKHGKHF